MLHDGVHRLQHLLARLPIRDLHAERLLDVDDQLQDVDRVQTQPLLLVEQRPVVLQLGRLDLEAGTLDDHRLDLVAQDGVVAVHEVRGERGPDSEIHRNHLSCVTVLLRTRVPSGIRSVNSSAPSSGLIATSERSNWTSSPSASVYAMRRRDPSASTIVSAIFWRRFRNFSSEDSRRTSI